jgi:hypothetical protein
MRSQPQPLTLGRGGLQGLSTLHPRRGLRTVATSCHPSSPQVLHPGCGSAASQAAADLGPITLPTGPPVAETGNFAGHDKKAPLRAQQGDRHIGGLTSQEIAAWG